MTTQLQANEVARDRTVHVSRTMMLSELSSLLDVTPVGADMELYQSVILEQNALLKRTMASRGKAWRFLRELYSLDREDPVFAPMRYLWSVEPSQGSRALLALLAAAFRDEVLRPTADVVLASPRGEVISKEDFSRCVGEAYPGRFGDASLAKIGRNIAATWTQSGHLKGRTRKVRTTVDAAPSVIAFAFYLGWHLGQRGLLLYSTPWSRLLDAGEHELDQHLFLASQRGWLGYKRIGDVVEIDMKPLLEMARTANG